MPIDDVLETWADAADVLRFTGQSVDEDTLVQAQDIIDLFSGITFAAADNLSPRNLRCLNRAVAYQAGWMPFHPDLFINVDVDNVSQDGASHTPSHENAALLAPFAHRWLRRLTWRQAPWRLRRRYGQSDYEDEGSRDSAVADDARTWTPMGH